MNRRVLSAVLCTLAVMGSAADAQVLQGMRSEVRDSQETEGRDSGGDDGEHDDKNRKRRGSQLLWAFIDQDENGESRTGKVLMAGLASPFTVPRAALNDFGGDGYFPKYPYGRHGGSLLFDASPDGAHSSLLVLQGDYGTDLGDLDHAHGRVFGDIANRFGFDTEFFFRREDLSGMTDELWNGDFNLTYRFAQSEHWQFRAGLGVNWLSDEFGTDAGVNVTYGAEWFPVKPWSFSSSVDWGRIGSTSLLHFRNTVGVTKGGWGIFTGHDYLSIGDESIHSWINGVEYRF